MGLFNKFKKPATSGGLGADVIRCDEKDYLIWKWHPSKYEEGTLKREAAIRTSSILHVKNGEVAIFVYKQKKEGIFEDYIVGPFEETIKTKNFPVLTSLIGIWYEGDTPFQAEVYFINLAKVVQIRYGVPYFDVVDPRYPDFQVPVAVRGSMTFKIDDYQDFIKHHRLQTFDLEDFRKQVNDSIIRLVKDEVANAPSEHDIPLINIGSKIGLINETVELKVKDRMREVFGVECTGFEINAIELDKESEAYAELRAITKDFQKDVALRKKEIDLENYEETLRIQREEGQYAQHMATKQTNLGAYQTEVSGQVGVAGAEALGKMGENGVGNINLGDGSSGFNPVTMMAGISLGNAVGQKMAGTLNTALNPESTGTTPPPVPSVKYYVAKDGQASGPFELKTLKGMAIQGSLKPDSLVWKEGMAGWEKASSQESLAGIFPPPIPQ